MHFTPIIRNMALQHAATGCVNELCLFCEMGFLFDMLEKAEGSICQATNLLKTFSSHPQGKSFWTVYEKFTDSLQRDLWVFWRKMHLERH